MAIGTSMGLHLSILRFHFLSNIFSVTSLSLTQWKAVLLISLPVILLDEILKFFSRNSLRRCK
jgi:hypothetical protein